MSGELKVVDDQAGQGGELRRRIARVEVLNVEGGDGELSGSWNGGSFPS